MDIIKDFDNEALYLIKLLGFYKDCVWVKESVLDALICKYKIIACLKLKEQINI